MYDLTAFIILGFAVWSLSHLLVMEDGPGGVLSSFRYAIGVNTLAEKQTNPLAGVFACVWCMSFWVGLIAGAWYFHSSGELQFVVYGLALRGVAIAVNDVVFMVRSRREQINYETALMLER